MTFADTAAPGTVTFHDSLGERRHVPDSSGAETLEVLCLRPDLASAPSFEAALRERAGQLASFRDAQYARIHGVELREGALALVSERIPGVRLSKLLDVAERQPLTLNIHAALALVRQLVPAVAVLHQTAPEVAHGAIGPERLIVTPHARLVIVEHALGGALEQLRFSDDRYWRDLRIPVPRSAGTPRFDQRTDVMQIGAVALALVLGRSLREDEYARVGEAVASAWATSARGGLEPLPPGFRSWLMRALQLDPVSSFHSAMDAWAELDKIFGNGDDIAAPEALETFLAQYYALEGSRQPAVAGVDTAITLDTEVGRSIDDRAIADLVSSASSAVEMSTFTKRHTTEGRMDTEVGRSPIKNREIADFMSSTSSVVENSYGSDQDVPAARIAEPRRWARVMGVAVVLIVLASGGVMAGRRYFAPSVARVATGTLAISTNPAGAHVSVDGEARGVTPINLALGAGAHIVELSGAGEPRSIPVTIVAGAQASQYVELQNSGPSSGQLQVRTDPPGARVTLDGLPRGTSPLTIGDLSPGAHTVTLENEVGSAKHDVRIEAGATAVLVAALTKPQSGPVSGWLSVAAPLNMQLYENGSLLGSSETERIMVPAGRHDIEIVNVPLGLRVVRSVQVTPGKVATIAVDLPKQRISLNAVPWAEVWIDGAKAGETPIGDVSVIVGPHEVVFRHPELGEQRHAITVTATEPARLSVDMRKK